MNYYEVLRIPSTASLSDIKNAYKKLVKKYHPDIYEGNKLFAECKIKEINEAYEMLKEENKKAAYDAELNYKKYEPTKESFVKTYTKEDIKQYEKVYNEIKSENTKKNIIKNKIKRKVLSINELGKKYFFKLDEKYKTDEKENFAIVFLASSICVLCLCLMFVIK